MNKIREILEKYAYSQYREFPHPDTKVIYHADFDKLEEELQEYVTGIAEVNFAKGCRYQIDELNEEKKSYEERE